MTKPKRPSQSGIDPKHPALSEHRPLIVDNRDGNSMAQAVQRHLQALRQDQAMLWGVKIATAFFNVPGFNLIADELEQVGKVQLLLGAEPRPDAL